MRDLKKGTTAKSTCSIQKSFTLWITNTRFYRKCGNQMAEQWQRRSAFHTLEQCKGILFLHFSGSWGGELWPAIDGKRSGIYFKPGDEKQRTGCNYLNSSGFLSSSPLQVCHLVNSKFHIWTMLLKPQLFIIIFFFSCSTTCRWNSHLIPFGHHLRRSQKPYSNTCNLYGNMIKHQNYWAFLIFKSLLQ